MESQAISYFAPSGPGVWRMADGDLSVWFCDDRDPSTDGRLLEMPVPGCKDRKLWSAEKSVDSVLAMTRDEKNGRMFRNGTLALRFVNGKESRPTALMQGSDEFKSFWHDDYARMLFRDIPDIWANQNRLRLWYKNPNVAAVWFVEIAVLAFFLLLARGRVPKVAGVIILSASLVGLLATSSRGGLLAFVAAVLLMGVALPLRKLRKKHIVIAAFAIATMAVGLAVFNRDGRYSKNFFHQDPQNSRIEIMKAVPVMIAASPVSGWGIGNSGEAYVSWFQKEATCLLKDMVGSHFTNLVEYNLLFRFLYLFGWCAVLTCAGFVAFKRRSPVPFGMLVAIFTASFFNPVFSNFELLVVPVALAALVLYEARKIAGRVFFLSAALASVTLVGLHMAGLRLGEGNAKIVRANGVVTVGDGPCSICVVDDGFTLNGGFWWLTGRELRDSVEANPKAGAIAWTCELDSLPSKVGKLVLVGEKAGEFIAAHKASAVKTEFDELAMVSPNVLTGEIPEELRRGKINVYRGAIAAMASGEAKVTYPWVHTVQGAALYIPSWLDLIRKQAKQKKESKK